MTNSADIFASKTYTPPKTLLQNRIVLVTGAGDGIGKVAAQTYAEHGATVILAGRTVPKLEAVYDQIIAAGHPEPSIYPIDLAGATEQHYAELADAIHCEFGKLDGLLHNASVLGARRAVNDYLLTDWDACMNVNIRSAFMMTKALLSELEKSEQGRVLFTTSGVGRVGKAHWGAYAASKFATEGLMQVLADELDGVSTTRVNAINPGATRTRMRATAYPAENPKDVNAPEDLMWLYLYLMGADSQEVHGESLNAGDR